MMPMSEHQFVYTNSQLGTEQRIAQLETELREARKDNSEVRRQLASKIVQLSRREQAVNNEQDSTSNKDRTIQQLKHQVGQLQAAVASKADDLEELKRLYASQKQMARDALERAAEREAALRYAEESSRDAAEEVVEDEMERLQQQLAVTQARAQLEVGAKEAEVQELRSQLAAATASRKAAVEAAEAALLEAWREEGEREVARLQGVVEELQGELARARASEAQRSSEEQGLPREVVEASKAKLQVVREFEAYRVMTGHTLRQNQEEVARLMQENASLQVRVATMKASELMDSRHPVGAFGEPDEGFGRGVPDPWLHRYLPRFMRRLDRERRGMLPMLLLLVVMAVILLVAVIRAVASTHQQEGGPLCFLSKLGISIGKGCGGVEKVVQKEMGKLIDQTQRIHDIKGEDAAAPAGAAAAVVRAAAKAEPVANATVEAMRLLRGALGV